MAAPSASPEVSFRQLYPGEDVQRLLREITDLGGNRFGKAHAASLGGFCHKAIGGLETFINNLAPLKVFRVGHGPEQLRAALQRATHYLTEKCTVAGLARLWAIEAAGGQSFVATETDARDHITEAVRLHVEVVVEAAKRNTEQANAEGRPIRMARQRRINTQVWHEISALNGSTEFGYQFMNGFREGLEESKTLNDVWKAIQDSMNVERCLGRKLDCIHKEVHAGRRFQEEDCCPEVFCLIPVDTSSWSMLRRVDRWRIFTKQMRLFFMCTAFFDEIRASMSPQPEVHRDFWDECSEFIDISQPSDFFAKYNRAIRMSILVLQTIGIATAFFGMPIKIGNISDLDDLADIMGQGLEAANEEFVAVEAQESALVPAKRKPTSQPRPLHKLVSRMKISKSATSDQPQQLPQPPTPAEVESRMRNSPPHLVMQHYLTSNSVEWKKSVQFRLKLAHNPHHGYTYVCSKNPQHESQWRLRAARGPMR